MNLMHKIFGAVLCLALPAAAAAQQDGKCRVRRRTPDLQGV